MTMLKKVQAAINRGKLLQMDDKILVGVSGGPDSVALLHCLLTLAPAYRLQLYAIHVNHMFRSEEAAADADFVRTLGEKWGIPVSIEAVDVPALVARTKESPEAVGRQVRLSVFSRISREVGANKIALGHHADDQAETVLMHLLRGAAGGGLGGMYPQRGCIIRPLLTVTRAEIEEYCRANSLAYRIDSSNKKPIYLRNRIRMELIPQLQSDYNPQIVARLTEMAELLRDEQEVLTAETERAWAQVVTERSGQWAVALPKFRQLPAALRRRVVREIYNRLTGGTGGLKYRDVEKVLTLAGYSEVGKVVQLPQQVGFRRDYEELIAGFNINSEAGQRTDGEYRLAVPGCTVVKEIGLKITASLVTSAGANGPAGEAVWQAKLDWAKVDPPLFLRFRRPGDVFHPLGGPGLKKLKDFFIDAKIPRSQRDAIPLIASATAVFWVVGQRLAEHCRVTDQTSQFLALQVEKIQPGPI